MDAAPFFRNPVFQLRAFGAFAPVASFDRKVSSSRSRQPVIVTGFTIVTDCDDAISADDPLVPVASGIAGTTAALRTIARVALCESFRAIAGFGSRPASSTATTERPMT